MTANRARHAIEVHSKRRTLSPFPVRQIDLHEVFHVNYVRELTGRFSIVTVALGKVPRLRTLTRRIGLNRVGEIVRRLQSNTCCDTLIIIIAHWRRNTLTWIALIALHLLIVVIKLI